MQRERERERDHNLANIFHLMKRTVLQGIIKQQQPYNPATLLAQCNSVTPNMRLLK